MAGSVAKLVNRRLSKKWLVLPNVRKGAGIAVPSAKTDWPRRVGLSRSAEFGKLSQRGEAAA